MKVRARLASVGGFVAVTGLVGLVSRWAGARLEVVAWMDAWGRGGGTAIRWGLLVGGLVLVVVGSLERAAAAVTAEPAPAPAGGDGALGPQGEASLGAAKEAPGTEP